MANDEWYTPEHVADAVRSSFCGGQFLDPCSCPAANEILCATKYYTKEQDGLSQPWDIPQVYINPPYSNPAPWVEKLEIAVQGRQVFAWVVLVNNQTDSKWFHALMNMCNRMVVLRSRVKFVSGVGKKSDSPRQGQVVFLGGAAASFKWHCLGRVIPMPGVVSSAGSW